MKNKYFILLVVLSLLPLLPLLLPGLPITHDGRDHVARIANFYQSLHDGNLIPRWAGNLDWGFGHPILMFLYPLPSYLASLFHQAGFSFIDSTKLVFALSYIMSGITMFCWLQTLFSKRTAFIGALLYLFAPYRFVDLYVRGALGEHVAFAFTPLVFYYLQKIKTTKQVSLIIGGSLSLAGLILSHNAISLMMIPLLVLYSAYLVLSEKKKKMLLMQLMMVFFMGFCLSSFFWLPAFFEGKYTLRDIVTAINVSDRLYPLGMFVSSPWGFGTTGQFSLQIGLFQWLAVIGGGVIGYQEYKKRTKLWPLTLFSILSFIIVLFLMTPYSLILWEKVSLIQKFQFPWRFLTLCIFFASFLGCIVVEKYIAKKRLLFIVLSVAIIAVTIPFWRVNGYLQKPDSYFSSAFASTTDTGESAPIWSVRFMEHFSTSSTEVIDGQAVVRTVLHQSEKHKYSITSVNGAAILENTLYFPGWKVLVDGKDTPIEFQNPLHRGLMIFSVPSGEHSVEVVFTETRLRLISDVLSIISLPILGMLVILNKYHLWRRFQ